MSVGTSIRSCVAHAVESHRTVSTPSMNDSTWLCCATAGPAISSHRPVTACADSCGPQPPEDTSPSSTEPAEIGSRAPGPAPLHWDSSAVRGRRRRRDADRLTRATSPSTPVRARTKAHASSTPSGDHSPDGRSRVCSVDTVDPPCGHVVAPVPASRAGTSAATAAVTITWSASPTRSARWSRRRASSSAKTSSSTRIGSSPSATQQVVGRQPQRQRERPRLAVAGVALRAGQVGPRLSTRSSRCGPTRLTPRSSSAGAASARDASSSAPSSSHRRRPAAASGLTPLDATLVGDRRRRRAMAPPGHRRRRPCRPWGRARRPAPAAASSSAPCAARCPSHTSSVARSPARGAALRRGRPRSSAGRCAA